MPGIDETQSRQIRLCRTLCIFFMMSVHVSPGLTAATAVTEGSMAWIGFLWGDILGRTSVAALSFLSGYLLWHSLRHAPLATVVRRKAKTLLAPMLVWNLIFVFLTGVGAAMTKDVGGLGLAIRDSGVLGSLTGLTGETANLSLFFLRDLFVAVILLRLFAPILERWPVAALAIVLALVLFDAAEPVLFRPAILLFAALGLVAASRGARLDALGRLRVAVPAGAALASLLLLVRTAAPAQSGVAGETEDLLLRGILTLVVLAATAGLAPTRLGAWLGRFERGIFETYLLHVPLISVLYVLWTEAVGPASEPAYVVFFLAAPLVALLAGQTAAVLATRLPAVLQIGLRGKARSPRGDRAPASTGFAGRRTADGAK